MKIAADENGGEYAGQQGWIRRNRRCGTEKYDMWDDGDGKMGCKDGGGLGKYGQRTTTNLRVYCRSGITGMAKKISDEDSSVQARWRRCGTTCMDKAMEDMQDGNIRDVG